MKPLEEIPTRARNITSLRDFLALLADYGQCLTWPEKVWPEPDIRKVAVAAGRDAMNGPALLFDQIVGYPGKTLALGVHGSFTNLALLLGKPKGSTVKELFYDMIGRWGSKGAQLERAPFDKAPVHGKRLEKILISMIFYPYTVSTNTMAASILLRLRSFPETLKNPTILKNRTSVSIVSKCMVQIVLH